MRSAGEPAEPGQRLRSPELRPRVMNGSYAAAVWDVASNRRHALRPGVGPRQDLAGGRIVVFGPDETLFDGAAGTMTGGYFEADNCPPWDTWVALTQFTDGKRGRAAHLFSWVPPAFVDSVDRGLDYSPEASVLWLEDWVSVGPSEIVDALRRASRGVADISRIRHE